MLEDPQIAEKLFVEGALNENPKQKISAVYSNRLFSVGIELRSILYIGILTLTGGFGVLVYTNIDTIGHLAVITFIALVSLACYAYCYTKRLPYSNSKVTAASHLTDYILLFGSLSFATFMGYLQYEYSAFGPHNEISFLIPAIVFFTIAYYFDHIGILSMAITAIAGFVGIAISPLQLLSSNDFSADRIVYSGLGLGIVLVAVALLLNKRNIKSHFTFTYLNFATHLLFISCLAGLFTFNRWIAFIPVLALLILIVMRYAYQERSFYFLLFAILYGYIGISYLFVRMAIDLNSDGGILILSPLYFIASSIFMIIFLRRTHKKFKPHDSL